MWSRCLAVTVLLLLTACGGGDGNDYSSQVRENFLNACATTSGGQDEACECMLDEIEERLTEEEFLEIEQQVVAEETTFEEVPEFQEATDACL